MLELLMILLIMFKGLKGKEVTIKTFIVLPIIMLVGLYNDYNGIKIQSFENIIEIIVLLIIALIAGIILGNMKIIEVYNGKYYIKSTYKYIGSWLVILIIRLLVSKVIFRSYMANDEWIIWAYYLVFYATRSIAVLLKYPEVAAIIREQK
jgi:hypothetical protein